MKKLTLILSSICLVSHLPAPAICAEVDKSLVLALNENARPHFQTLMIDSVLKITASDLNICDDSIVEAIGYPRPLAVSEALESIQHELQKPTAVGKSIVVDLSTNTINDDSAQMIGCYFSRIHALQNLNLSWNGMTDAGIGTLIEKLKPMLVEDTFLQLVIKGNPGANRANIRKLLKSFTETEQALVKGKIQYE
jgi:hypothetical protein